MYIHSLPDNAVFDYVVCGAGASGCVVAEKLSQNNKYSVLLLEPGGPIDSINIKIPLLVANLLNNEKYTWPYETEPQMHLNGKRQRWTRGRVIGGSGSINGNLFVRGDPKEYDHWKSMGCTGWGYDELLPIFRHLEDFPEGDQTVRGTGGPIHCTRLDHFDKLSDAFIEACQERGFTLLPDYNDGSYEGVFYLQYSTRNGLRNSSAAGYLSKASHRKNLSILTSATTTRVLLEGNQVTGVEYSMNGALFQVKANREVILSAGPLASPQILELSGIGNSEILNKFGIKTVHHLPGVGENLRDHPNTRITFKCSKPITINDVLQNPLMKIKEGMRFIFKREGLLTICSATAQMNYRSNPELKQPDLVLRLLPLSGADRYARTPQSGMDKFSGFTFGITTIQPKSIGSLHLQSPDPLVQASMDPKYLSHEDDANLFLKGFQISREVAQMPALTPLVVEETRPGKDIQSNDEILGYIKNTIQTAWHMVGTCKMGTDPMSVVDPELKVRGIGKLRVIDSSICPTIPSSNTNIPSIAIGEKGSNLILST
jgi:choline dehydrogenase